VLVHVPSSNSGTFCTTASAFFSKPNCCSLAYVSSTLASSSLARHARRMLQLSGSSRQARIDPILDRVVDGEEGVACVLQLMAVRLEVGCH
jgi:hypothetical protein